MLDRVDSGVESLIDNEEYLYTVVVAFCSFAYELIFSELLTVIYGGGAVRYAITIGLYMFFLGCGAFITKGLKHTEENFQRLELYMALAPLGFFFVVALTNVPLSTDVALILSHAPVILIGFLSGMEIPFLTTLAERKTPTTDTKPTDIASKIGNVTKRVFYAVIGLFFSRKSTSPSTAQFSTILGFDYVGSLLGSVIYALFLYPQLGLVKTVFIIGLLNGVVATIATLRYSETSRAVFMITLLLTAGYSAAILNGSVVEEETSQVYLSSKIESEYNMTQSTVGIDITETWNTDYQKVTWYDRSFENPDYPTESCLRLDTAVQLCESWVDSYHSGLVDAPMSMYSNTTQENMSVLIVGGGDWIAIDRLRQYGVTIDHVDIDKQFYEYSKNASKLEKHHNNAYEYDRLTSHPEDIFSFFSSSNEKYDMIILDIPGIRDTESIGLYSTEFFSLLNSHLTDQGVVVSWMYSPYSHNSHNKVYMETIDSAGFDYYHSYNSYDNLDNNPDTEIGERFIIMSPDKIDKQMTPSTPYMKKHDQYYTETDTSWYRTKSKQGVRPNSLFSPNYNIIVE